MRVTFVLPGYSELPIGGFKAAYQFANGLAERGHVVCVLHPHSMNPIAGAWAWTRRATWPLRTRLRQPRLLPWFRTHPRVDLRLVPDLEARHAPDADCVVATAWQTAQWVRAWGPRKGTGFCLVADYEQWAVGVPAVRRQMGEAFSGLHLVAYGPAVRQMLGSLGLSPAVEVRVGADDLAFGLDRDLPSRPRRLGFPVRDERWKGTWDAIAAVSLLHLRRPDVGICAFGRAPLPQAPDWLEYHLRPTDGELRALYNSIAVFVHPSHYEAWPLPPLEAMLCGAALLAADSVGVCGFARHDENAFVVPPGRPDLLAEAADELLTDAERRQRLATQGRADARQYRWPEAVRQLERALADHRSPATLI